MQPKAPGGGEALLALAARCEGAGVEEQGWDMLAEHSDEFRRFALASPDSGFDNNAARFGMALEAKAYESAAMMLLPTNGTIDLLDVEFSWEPSKPEVWPAASVRWYPPRMDGKHWHALVVSGATLGLTLCAAALTARGRALAYREDTNP